MFSVLLLVDFWSLPDSRLTGYLTERVERSFYRRCPPEERPAFIQENEDGDVSKLAIDGVNVPLQSLRSTKTPKNAGESKSEEKASEKLNEPRGEILPTEGGKSKKHDANLAIALHNVFWLQWWTAGIFKLISGTRRFS